MENSTETAEVLKISLALCAEILEQAGEKFWSKKLRIELNHLENGQLNIRKIRSWYGGSGSLLDLIISKENGHRIDPENADLLNDRFQEELSKIYKSIYRETGNSSVGTHLKLNKQY